MSTREIIAGLTQDLDLLKINFCNHHLIESVSFLHTAVKDLLNQNFLSQQIESASCIEVQAFIKTKIQKKCIKGRKSEGVGDPEKNKKIVNIEKGNRNEWWTVSTLEIIVGPNQDPDFIKMNF